MSKKTRTVVLSLLSALYIAGLVSMFFNFTLGLVLWAAALIPSLVLYLYQKHIQQLAAERELNGKSENAEE